MFVCSVKIFDICGLNHAVSFHCYTRTRSVAIRSDVRSLAAVFVRIASSTAKNTDTKISAYAADARLKEGVHRITLVAFQLRGSLRVGAHVVEWLRVQVRVGHFSVTGSQIVEIFVLWIFLVVWRPAVNLVLGTSVGFQFRKLERGRGIRRPDASGTHPFDRLGICPLQQSVHTYCRTGSHGRMPVRVGSYPKWKGGVARACSEFRNRCLNSVIDVTLDSRCTGLGGKAFVEERAVCACAR